MAFHLSPVSRRRFLGTAAAASLVTLRLPAAETPRVDPDRWAFLADTHIAADPKQPRNGVVMSDNLQQVLQEILQLDVRPAGAFLNGDCAVTKGEAGDYATLASLLKPLSAGGVPLHMTLGNHDDRANFRAGFEQSLPKQPLLESKHVSVVESRHANFFLLDSLDIVNATPGKLGGEQLGWLAKELDASRDKPAIVFVHHTPEITPPKDKHFGVIDTQAFFDVLLPRKHVKAYVFGHSHNWNTTVHDGLHLVNLPPVAYVFQKGRPNGWVDARLHPDRMTLKLVCLDKAHADHGRTVELRWRS